MIADNVVALAVAKLYNKDRLEPIRDAVASGTYEIDATIRFQGVLKTHDTHMAQNHQRLCPLKLIAILLDNMPKQVRDARIREAVGRLAAGETPDVSDIKDVTEDAVERAMEATSQPRRGKAIYVGDASIVVVPAMAMA